ncbi:MAG: matrixin family metalloprotease [Anaerolineae bacterium]
MKNLFALLCVSFVAVIILSAGLMLLSGREIGHAAPIAPEATACDAEALTRIEADFRRMADLRAREPGAISDEAYRSAALAYIASAETCYNALAPSGSPARAPAYSGPAKIDDGGLWAPGYGPTASGGNYGEYVTFGSKWGAGTPFSGGQDAPGPGITGGTVTYSYIANGVDHSGEGAGTPSNTHISGLTGYSTCFLTEISTAFAAWSAVADIQFVEVADNGLPTDAAGAEGDIRIGAHLMDGASGTLAHAFFPPPNGVSIAGDLHFDTGETWSCTAGGSAIDIGLVALHEIGHSIGLGHEPLPSQGGDQAVMNAFYDPSLTGLLTDDIEGAVSIYGAAQMLPDLSIVQQVVGSTQPSPGDAITITLTVENKGTVTVTGVVVTDTLSTSILTPTQASSIGATERGGAPFIWDLPDLAGGASGLITVSGIISPSLDPNFIINNTATIAGNEQETNTGNNSSTAFIGGAGAYLPFVAKVVGSSTSPQSGYWQSTNQAHEFHVNIERTEVNDYAIFITVSGCGNYKVTRTLSDSIVDNQFSFTGAFFASGTFDSSTTASGTDGLDGLLIPGCGLVSGGPFTWTANWQGSAGLGPAFLTAEVVEAVIVEPIGGGGDAAITVTPVE